MYNQYRTFSSHQNLRQAFVLQNFERWKKDLIDCALAKSLSKVVEEAQKAVHWIPRSTPENGKSLDICKDSCSSAIVLK